MTEERGRQRSTKKNPKRETLVDKQTTDVVTQHALLLGDIERVKNKIDKQLESYSVDKDDVLTKLSEELSTLTTALESLQDRLT